MDDIGSSSSSLSYAHDVDAPATLADATAPMPDLAFVRARMVRLQKQHDRLMVVRDAGSTTPSRTPLNSDADDVILVKLEVRPSVLFPTRLGVFARSDLSGDRVFPFHGFILPPDRVRLIQNTMHLFTGLHLGKTGHVLFGMPTHLASIVCAQGHQNLIVEPNCELFLRDPLHLASVAIRLLRNIHRDEELLLRDSKDYPRFKGAPLGPTLRYCQTCFFLYEHPDSSSASSPCSFFRCMVVGCTSGQHASCFPRAVVPPDPQAFACSLHRRALSSSHAGALFEDVEDEMNGDDDDQHRPMSPGVEAKRDGTNDDDDDDSSASVVSVEPPAHGEKRGCKRKVLEWGRHEFVANPPLKLQAVESSQSSSDTTLTSSSSSTERLRVPMEKLELALDQPHLRDLCYRLASSESNLFVQHLQLISRALRPEVQTSPSAIKAEMLRWISSRCFVPGIVPGPSVGTRCNAVIANRVPDDDCAAMLRVALRAIGLQYALVVLRPQSIECMRSPRSIKLVGEVVLAADTKHGRLALVRFSNARNHWLLEPGETDQARRARYTAWWQELHSSDTFALPAAAATPPLAIDI